MRRPSRRSVVASAVPGVALVAGATVAYATRDRGATSALAPLDVPREVVPEQPVHSPSPTPATSSPAKPTPKPVATSSAPQTAFGPRLPGSVVAPYRPGQTSWDATSNGYRFHVSTTPGRQGEPMTWTVDVANAPSGCCGIFVSWSDGFGDITHATCETPATHLSSSHVFNRAGRHDFAVQVNAHCGNGRDGALYGSFDVASGTTTAQGPALPTVQFDWSEHPGPRPRGRLVVRHDVRRGTGRGRLDHQAGRDVRRRHQQDVRRRHQPGGLPREPGRLAGQLTSDAAVRAAGLPPLREAGDLHPHAHRLLRGVRRVDGSAGVEVVHLGGGGLDHLRASGVHR